MGKVKKERTNDVNVLSLVLSMFFFIYELFSLA